MGMAAAAGLLAGSVVFYLARIWLRREPVGGVDRREASLVEEAAPDEDDSPVGQDARSEDDRPPDEDATAAPDHRSDPAPS
jgi:hypothetical protein